MNATGLLDQVRAQGVAIETDGRMLTLRPAGKIGVDLRAAIVKEKQAIIAALIAAITQELYTRSQRLLDAELHGRAKGQGYDDALGEFRRLLVKYECIACPEKIR